MPSDNIYAIATAAAKKAGYSNFDKDSDGEEKREEIVLALKRRGMKKATYGANNDQARKVGQRTNVKRNPRLNPNKLGVSDIIKEKKERNNPRKRPNIVAQGREDDLYPTGSQFAADAGDKNPVSKKFDNEEEDNTHQLGVRRRDGETDKLSSPAGSTIQAEQVTMEKGVRDIVRGAGKVVSDYRERKKEQAEATTREADNYYRQMGMASGLKSVDKLRRKEGRVGAVSKAILKQGLLDLLIQKKDKKPRSQHPRLPDKYRSPWINPLTRYKHADEVEERYKKADKESPFSTANLAKADDWPHKNITREQAERISRSRGVQSAADVTQTYIDEEEETQDDRQPHQKPKRSRNKRRRRGRSSQDTTVEDTIPSPEEKTQSQMEFDEDVSEDRGDIHGENEQHESSPRRGGSRQGSRRRGEIPRSGWNPDLQNMLKAREQGDGKGVDPTGKDPLRGKPNKTNERYANADMGAMSYMAKDYDGDRKARIAAAKAHFAHRLFGVACSCEQYGEREPFVEKGLGDIARGAGQKLGSAIEGVKKVGSEFKEGFKGQQQKKPSPTPRDSAGSQRIGGADFSSRTKPQSPSKPTPRSEPGFTPAGSIRQDAAGQAEFRNIRDQVDRDRAKRAAAGDPKAQAAQKLTQATQRRIADKKAAKKTPTKTQYQDEGRRATPEDIASGEVYYMDDAMHEGNRNYAYGGEHRPQPGDSNPRKMLKSGSGAPLASAEKPVAVMAAEQSGMYSVDGKNLDIDPMANKAPQESVNQTDAATRKASVSTDNQGRNKYIQLEVPNEEQDYKDAEIKLHRQSGRQYRNKGTIRGGSRRPESDFNTNTTGSGKDASFFGAPDSAHGESITGERGGMSASKRDHYPSKGRKQDQREANLAAFISKPQTKKDTEAGMKSTYGHNIQNSVEPTICSSKEVFNSILEKTYYDDQVLERYEDSEKGKTKKRSKRRNITNDIADTAGQTTNKTRGI